MILKVYSHVRGNSSNNRLSRTGKLSPYLGMEIPFHKQNWYNTVISPALHVLQTVHLGQ